MKISLIHPSRGRPEKAKQTYDYWMSRATNTDVIEHLLSLDFSDKTNEQYGVVEGDTYKPFGPNSRIVIDHNESVVEATNAAAAIASGDVLVYMSDDFLAPQDWDKHLLNYFQSAQGPCLLKVDDCLQEFHVPVLTIPVMNRELYSKLRYFWHPGYRSMFVDEDLYWTCNNNGWLDVAPYLKFPHEHCSIGKAERDETYIRSEANWNQGKAFFEQRRALNFPL